MRGSDYFLVGLTFLTGVFAGVYVYVTAFAPTFVYDPITATEDIAFELSGQAYGGCERASEQCDRFTITEDRSYEYTPALGRGEAAPEPVTGVLSRTTYDQVRDQVARTPLSALDATGGRCVSAVDGIDYRYRLVYEGEEYFFDTCGTRFTDSRLADTFLSLWPMVATSSSWVDSVSDFNFGDSVGGWLHDTFRGE